MGQKVQTYLKLITFRQTGCESLFLWRCPYILWCTMCNSVHTLWCKCIYQFDLRILRPWSCHGDCIWLVYLLNRKRKYFMIGSGARTFLVHTLTWQSVCDKVFYDMCNPFPTLFVQSCFFQAVSTPLKRTLVYLSALYGNIFWSYSYITVFKFIKIEFIHVLYWREKTWIVLSK